MGIEILVAAGIAAAISAGSYAINYALAGAGPRPQAQDNGRQIDPRISGSRYGAFIQRHYGTVELAGQVIWASPILDVPSTTPGTNSKRGSTPTTTTHRYYRSFAVLFCAGPIYGITRIKADDKTYYNGETMGEFATDKIHVYVGNETQTPNSWIEADKGVGNVPANRGYCVVVFKDFPIDEYGDRIPNIRAEIIKSSSTPTLRSIVEEETALCNLDPSEIDATALEDVTVGGYFVNQLANVRSSLEQLSAAYQFIGTEYDGKINFRKLPGTPVATVNWDELGTIEDEDSGDEDQPPPRVSLRRKLSSDIPRSVEVVYYDRDRAYEEGTQSYRRQHLGNVRTSPRNFNIVFSPEEASRLAKILAVTGWTERVSAEFSLPSEYLVYAAGDVLTVPVSEEEGDTIDVRIEEMAMSAPGVVRVKGTRQFAEAYTQTGDPGGEGEDAPDDDPVDEDCEPELWIDDRWPFRDREQGTPGHYVAVGPVETCGDLPGERFRGASIVRNVDGVDDWRGHAVITEAALMGTADTVLADGTGLDTVNTVNVYLPSGTVPASISDAAFEADHTLSLWAIGGETCQVRDITDLGGGFYEFSHIRRALFHTEDQTATHSIGERVVLLDERVQRVSHNLEEVGETYDFRAVPPDGDIDDFPDYSFTYGARGVEPGGDVPSAPGSPVVTDNNGQPVLIWEVPAENNNTIQSYTVTVYEDAGHTIPKLGYQNIEVTSNQFTLPADVPDTELFYEISATNLLGTSSTTTGSYTPTAPVAGAHATTHEVGGGDPLTGLLDANARVAVRKNSTGSVFTRRRINLIEGANVTLTVADDGASEEVDITIAAPDPTVYAYRTISSNATAAAGDQVIFINVTAGAVTLTLPTAVGRGGKWYSVKVTGSGNNLATIDPNGSETFDGSSTAELAVGDRLRFMSDNSNWQSIA